MEIAQTNLQLYNQLLAQCRPLEELLQAKRGYELAMRLFSGKYRASGKPFLAHLVGTASILAWLEQPIDVVVAGLVHAAFDAGDFSDGQQGVSKSRRVIMTEFLCAEVVELVENYHQSSRADCLGRLVTPAATVPFAAENRTLRNIQLLHVCDTIEEHADAGMGYAPLKEHILQDVFGSDVAGSTVAAPQKLGLGQFTLDLRRAFALWDQYRLPQQMLSNHSGSYFVAPPSYREKALVKLRGRCVKWQARARNRLKLALAGRKK